MGARVVLSMLVSGAVLALSAPLAGAATVERIGSTDPFGGLTGSYYLVYTASPGEANDLEIRIEPDAVQFHEASVPVTVKGCDQVDPTTARCGTGSSIRVELGDGDDAARVADTRPPPAGRFPDRSGVLMDAGAGADALTGGPGDDFLFDGGTGETDRFTGGGGDDLMSYGGRKQPVRITVGAPGEDVLRGFETLRGSDGDDVLSGNGVANTLWGGEGDDVIRGRGGADSLDGEGGSDRIFGGLGSDDISGDDVASSVGPDILSGGPGADLFDLGAEDDDESLSVAGATYNPAPDGERDTVRGGSGYDTVDFRDPGDRLRSVDAEILGEGVSVSRRLRRVSRTQVSVRIGIPDAAADDRFRLVLTPGGRSGPRLTRPVRVSVDERTIRLRLTAAGVRYLRSHRAATLRSSTFFASVPVRVSR